MTDTTKTPPTLDHLDTASGQETPSNTAMTSMVASVPSDDHNSSIRMTDADMDDEAMSDMPQLEKKDDCLLMRHNSDDDTSRLDSGPSPLPPQLDQEVPGRFSIERDVEEDVRKESTDEEDSDAEESSEDEASNHEDAIIVEDSVQRSSEDENDVMVETRDDTAMSGSDVDTHDSDAERGHSDRKRRHSDAEKRHSDAERQHSDTDESDNEEVRCSEVHDNDVDGQCDVPDSDVERSDDACDAKIDSPAYVAASEVEHAETEHVSTCTKGDNSVVVTSGQTHEEVCSESENVVDVPTEHDTDTSSSDYDDSDADDEDAAMSPNNQAHSNAASDLKERQVLQCAVEAIAEDHEDKNNSGTGGLDQMDSIAEHDMMTDTSQSHAHAPVAGLVYGRSFSTGGNLGNDVVKVPGQPVVHLDSVAMETLPSSSIGSTDASSIETANAVAALNSSAGFISTVDMVDVPQLGLSSPTSINSGEMNSSSVETTPPSQGFADCAQVQQTFCGSNMNSSPGGFMEAVNPQLTSPVSTQITSPQPPTPHTNQKFNMPNPSPSSNNANFNMPNPSPSNSSGFSIPNHSPSNNNASCAIASHSPSNNTNNFSLPNHSPSNNAAPAAGTYGGMPTHSPSNHGASYGMPNPSPSNPSANFNMPNPSPGAANNFNMPNPSPGNSAPGSNYSMPTPSPTNSSHSFSMATPSPTGTANTYTLQSQAMIAPASASANFNMCSAAMHINNNYMQLLPTHNTQRLTHNVQGGSCAMLAGARSRQHKFQQVVNSSCSLAKLQQLTNGISDFIPENTMTPPPNLTPPPPVNMTPPPAAALHRNMTPPDLTPQSYKQYQRRTAAIQKAASAGNMSAVNPGMSFTPNVTIQPGTNMITGYNMQLMNGYRMPQPMNYTGYMANASFVNQPTQLGMMNMYPHNFPQQMQQNPANNAAAAAAMYSAPHGYTLSPQAFNVNMNGMMRR